MPRIHLFSCVLSIIMSILLMAALFLSQFPPGWIAVLRLLYMCLCLWKLCHEENNSALAYLFSCHLNHEMCCLFQEMMCFFWKYIVYIQKKKRKVQWLEYQRFVDYGWFELGFESLNCSLRKHFCFLFIVKMYVAGKTEICLGKGNWIHLVDIPPFSKGGNFYDFLFAFLHTKFFLKEILL